MIENVGLQFTYPHRVGDALEMLGAAVEVQLGEKKHSAAVLVCGERWAAAQLLSAGSDLLEYAGALRVLL